MTFSALVAQLRAAKNISNTNYNNHYHRIQVSRKRHQRLRGSLKRGRRDADYYILRNSSEIALTLLILKARPHK